jgi:hypothetical protein
MSHSNAKECKSWFIAAIVFAIWAYSIDFLWTRVVINGSVTSEAARINHLIRERGSEIPIFGPSKARADYVSEVLGPDVFNYGMDGTSFDVIECLVQIESHKNKRTPIILDMPHAAFHAVGDPSKLTPFASNPEIRSMLDRLGLMRWRYRVPGLRYFGYYDWFLKDYLAEHVAVTKKTVRGYTTEFNAIPFDRQKFDGLIAKRLEAGYGFSNDPDQDRRLFDIIRMTPQRTFIVVFSPVHPSCFSNFKDPEGFAQYLEKLRSFPNVVVLDYGRMECPDDCFRDTVHLNHKGALMFSQRLAGQLQIILAATSSGPHSPMSWSLSNIL